MKLVVDTCIVFSFFKADSFVNKMLEERQIELFAPPNIIDELSKYSEIICSKAGISKETFLEDISLLPELIDLRSPSQDFVERASELISHKSDVSFLALALEFKLPVWSDDVHFKEQSLIKVFNTKELVEKLRSTFSP